MSKQFHRGQKDYRKTIKDHFGNDFDRLLQLNGQSVDGNGMVKSLNKLKRFVEVNKYGITTSQLRNIYAQALSLNQGGLANMAKLKYKLAYVAGRQRKKNDTEQFTTFIDMLLEETAKSQDPKAIGNFLMVMEAVVAYHRYFNPKEN